MKGIVKTLFGRHWLLIIFITLLYFSQVHAQQTTTSQNPYCNSMFTNNPKIVTNAFAPGTTGTAFTKILSISLLITLTMLSALAIVYGIGIGFKIDKLVNFVKTEYMESIFNIAMVIIIAAGVASLTGASVFISNIMGISSNVAPQKTIQGFYTQICSNIYGGVIENGFGIIVWSLLNYIPYNVITQMTVTIQLSGIFPIPYLSSLLPAFTLKPFAGGAPFQTLVYIQIAAVAVIIFLGVAVIFLFYIIFFLFPVFLYAGVILRSFPWTRAAGGALISLFIAFYIIFPALFYPFTVSNNQSSIFQCNTDYSGVCGLPGFGTLLGNTISNFFGYVVNHGQTLGEIFVQTDQLYARVIAYTAIEFIGLGIAFVISYDLLDSLCDILGAPSMHAEKIFARLI
jgi:hypothetical protein